MCPSCQAPVLRGDRFCEACGAELPDREPESVAVPTATEVAPGTCANCGAVGEIAEDGYCGECGYKQPDPHDHEEIDLGWVAGVTDRGLRHPRNEDAMAVIAPSADTAVAIVCDGVSSSANADAAAEAAAGAAGDVLAGAAMTSPDLPAELADVLSRAASAADNAVKAVARTETGDPPSCTFVAAVARRGLITVAWIGDSRAYWLGVDAGQRLTTDDSWAAEQIAAGTMTDADAERDERAHSITRWLGSDAPAGEPHVVTFLPKSSGRVVVCSDGLWNYASTPESLAAQLARLPADADPLAVARHLTDYARDSGGHDNITVVVIAVEPSPDGPTMKGEA
jgi:PPM family protein phosphatase